MGMLGSETALEELTYRAVGDQLEEVIITKLSDDLSAMENCKKLPFTIFNNHCNEVNNLARYGKVL